MQPGTQAVLDRLSDPERQLLTALVRHPQRKRRDLAKLAGLPRTQADQACAQLESAGLLTPINDLLAFRDAHTEAAIRASMLPAGG